MARIGWAALCVTVFAIGYFLVTWQTDKKKDAWALSTIMVRAGLGHGSGVQIAPGLFLTAAHVIENGKPVAVASDGREAPADVLWVSKAYDVALIRAAGLTKTSVSPLHCEAVSTGLRVKAIGNPGPFQFAHSWGRVAIGEPEERDRWKSTIIVDVTAGPGSSGGPVFDMRGRVIGLVVAYAPSYPGFMLVVPASVVCDLTARVPFHYG
jgi:S1-C subfamily serine protease